MTICMSKACKAWHHGRIGEEQVVHGLNGPPYSLRGRAGHRVHPSPKAVRVKTFDSAIRVSHQTAFRDACTRCTALLCVWGASHPKGRWSNSLLMGPPTPRSAYKP